MIRSDAKLHAIIRRFNVTVNVTNDLLPNASAIFANFVIETVIVINISQIVDHPFGTTNRTERFYLVPHTGYNIRVKFRSNLRL